MIEKMEELNRFRNIADEYIQSDYEKGFFALVEHLDLLVNQTSMLSKVCADALSNILADRNYEQRSWEPHSILLSYGARWELRLGIYERTSDFIYTLPHHCLVAVVGQTPLKYDIYAPLAVEDRTLFYTGYQLTKRGIGTVQPGEILQCHSAGDLIDLQIEVPVWTVKLVSAPHEPIQWAFDRKTLQSCQGIAANMADSELILLTRALAAMERPEAANGLEDLAGHPSHFVRWAAIQSLAKCAPEIAYNKLIKAIEDSHPHVQAAARRTLHRLDESRGFVR